MKNILLTTIALLGITACNSTSSGKQSIEITAKCNNNDTSSYQLLQSGDIVSKPETLHDGSASAPEIKVIHLENGTKKVCLVSGSAVILR